MVIWHNMLLWILFMNKNEPKRLTLRSLNEPLIIYDYVIKNKELILIDTLLVILMALIGH